MQSDATSLPADILVVDDHAETRELLDAHLANAGYRVLTAKSGPEALDAVAAHPPDLILLDVMMPGMDGYEVCRRLKSDERTAFIPIIILTALHDFELRLQGIELGADEFLSKPFNHPELLTRVRSLLRVKALHDQVAASNRRLEEKVAERTAALERALTDLQEMDRLKSEFLSNISHELRTPLTPIKGYLPAILREEFGGLTPEQRRVLGHVAASVERLHRLIDDLLTFIQWEGGEGNLCLASLEMKLVVEAGLAGVAAAAREKGVKVVGDVPADLPPIRGDAAALGRAFGHLLENAVKFTPQGGSVMVSARLVDSRSREPVDSSKPIHQFTEQRNPPQGEWVELLVRDTGVGIPPEALPKIFDRFYQVDSSSTRQHGGTGLGLAIVKRILDAHGASIVVESLEGMGTSFSIRFPITA